MSRYVNKSHNTPPKDEERHTFDTTGSFLDELHFHTAQKMNNEIMDAQSEDYDFQRDFMAQYDPTIAQKQRSPPNQLENSHISRPQSIQQSSQSSLMAQMIPYHPQSNAYDGDGDDADLRHRNQQYQREYLEAQRFNDPQAYHHDMEKQYRQSQSNSSAVGFASMMANFLPSEKDIPDDSPFLSDEAKAQRARARAPSPEEMIAAEKKFLSSQAVKDMNPLLARQPISDAKSVKNAEIPANTPDLTPRYHSDSLKEEPFISIDYLKGKGAPRLVQDEDVRHNGEFVSMFQRTCHLFAQRYPHITFPTMTFSATPVINRPFEITYHYNNAQLSMLMLGKKPLFLRKMFRAITPDYIEDFDKLNILTESLYFSPQRIQFNMAKAFAMVHYGQHNPGHLLRLGFWHFFSKKRYLDALYNFHEKSDDMAIKVSPDIAIGGVEHLTKLYHYNTLYRQDINALPNLWFDDSVVAARRLNHMLYSIEDEHNLKPHDTVRLTFNKHMLLDPENVKLYLNLVKEVQEGSLSPQQLDLMKKYNQEKTKKKLEEVFTRQQRGI